MQPEAGTMFVPLWEIAEKFIVVTDPLHLYLSTLA